MTIHIKWKTKRDEIKFVLGPVRDEEFHLDNKETLYTLFHSAQKGIENLVVSL